MLDGGADQPAAILEDEHVGHVVARPERRRARGPELDHPGRPFFAQRRERGAVVGGMQDDLMTSAGQGRPAIRDMPDVVGLGCLEPARAERARSFREVGTLLPPRGDHHRATRQRIDTQVSVAHESSPYAAARYRRAADVSAETQAGPGDRSHQARSASACSTEASRRYPGKSLAGQSFAVSSK